MHREDRIIVGSGVRPLEAAALINRDVDQYGTRPHLGYHRIGYQLRRLSTRDKYGTNDQVGVRHGLFDRERVE